GLVFSVSATHLATRSARFSTGWLLRPSSYFIQHMALIFSRVTPPSFHQFGLAEARALWPDGAGVVEEVCCGPAASALAQPASARQTSSVAGCILKRMGNPFVWIRLHALVGLEPLTLR